MDDDLIVTRAQLEKIVGVSHAAINLWAKEGMPKHARGKYHLPTCIQWLLDRGLRGSGRKEAKDMTEARKRLYEAQEERTTLEVEVTKKGLLQSTEAHHVMAEICSIVVGGLDGFPGRLAPLVAPVEDIAELEQTVGAEVRRLREQISKRVRQFERDYPPGGGAAADTTKPKRRTVGRRASRPAA